MSLIHRPRTHVCTVVHTLVLRLIHARIVVIIACVWFVPATEAAATHSAARAKKRGEAPSSRARVPFFRERLVCLSVNRTSGCCCAIHVQTSTCCCRRQQQISENRFSCLRQFVVRMSHPHQLPPPQPQLFRPNFILDIRACRENREEELCKLPTLLQVQARFDRERIFVCVCLLCSGNALHATCLCQLRAHFVMKEGPARADSIHGRVIQVVNDRSYRGRGQIASSRIY